MFLRLHFLVMVAVLAIGSTATASEETAVLDIKGTAAFEEALASSPLLAVDFFAPWCGHCVQLAPTWEGAAAALKQRGSAAVVAKVDCTEAENHDLARRFEIRGYPTIILFKDGNGSNPMQYPGAIEASAIAEYLAKRAIPTVVKLETASDVTKFFSEVEGVGVVAFVSEMDAAALSAFKQMAEALLGGVVCAYVNDRPFLGLPCTEGDCDSPVAVMKKEGEVEKQRYEGDFSKDLLVQWTSSRAAPLVVHVAKGNEKLLGQARNVQLPHVVVVLENDVEVTPDVVNEVKAAAEAYYDLKFFIIGKSNNGKHLRAFGIDLAIPTPAFYIHVAANRTKFIKSGEKIQNLPEFLEEFKVGALEPVIFSEDPAAVKSTGHIVTVTGRTYRDLVHEAGKAVILIVYATPGTKKSAAVEAVLEEVAKLLEPRQDAVRVAKIDVAKNDIPDARLKVSQYPGVFFVPADPAGKVLKYRGEATKPGVLAWVEQQMRGAANEGGTSAGHDEL